MKIIVGATTDQLECPYCHDALAEPTNGCSQCGTLYHEECARTAVRCAILGCEANLGAKAAPETVFAVVLVPPEEATAVHEEALLRALPFSRWDAHQKLIARVPVILGWLERARIEPVLKTLEDAELEAFAIDARALAVREPFIVRSVTREGERLVLTSTRREKRELGLASERFVVTGRQKTVADGSSLGAHSGDTARFAHVWLPGEGKPIVFEQGELKDFAFLGTAKGPSGYENLRLLGELLAHGQRSDSSLDALGDTHLRAKGGFRPQQGFTNRSWILATSRLIAHARAPWLAGGARA